MEIGRFVWGLIPFLVIFIVLDVVLRGVALWRSSKRDEKGWFVALLVINSIGIFPLIYLLTHPEKKSKKK
ncbi:MAG: hypothetical protein UV74_C0013G0251 [Candidatus Woesebacteria bacterium GW2011_GWB1_43_14]|uniref:DUF5652 domain-containing protein n=1 Tax=Candidatus Woesebacteria bacterium GW2011_GWB1_43_14 TaxID=1618578 RepID=A0A0G1DHH5_9BACT|nr:MAG: hypothetical protein UT21_C0002G0042 [Candidatus Woesebacteria bacterium GW2011_GWA1_39_11b]KKS78455.1 MAG: hypothetical protein UV51_C0001G0171 [Candidatus Woesebacteria bacterium GW2011_GWC1_42_9]KKS97129.1 MAG: hypothetical protein UV74_C0013G0251 [Candidatus Woesebacteria bacterium GW2011_GWB1_43_14]